MEVHVHTDTTEEKWIHYFCKFLMNKNANFQWYGLHICSVNQLKHFIF